LIHDGCSKWRLEGEQFRFPDEVLSWLCSLDDREFGKWNETNFDPRFIGFEHPRYFGAGDDEKRGWQCVFFPEVDTIAWSIVLGRHRPDWSEREKMWLQDPRGFTAFQFAAPLANPPRPQPESASVA
jgi:hypothetical protein